MKTIVLEAMPDLFWETLKNKKIEKYFYQNEKEVALDKINIAIIRTKIQFNQELFHKLPNLKLIIRSGSGFDNIDIKIAKKKILPFAILP